MRCGQVNYWRIAKLEASESVCDTDQQKPGLKSMHLHACTLLGTPTETRSSAPRLQLNVGVFAYMQPNESLF